MRRYGNKNFSGSSYATDIRIHNLLKHKVLEKDRLEFLKTITSEEYEKIAQKLLNNVRVEGLVVGNCVKSDVEACGKLINKILKSSKPASRKVLGVYKLEGETLVTRNR